MNYLLIIHTQSVKLAILSFMFFTDIIGHCNSNTEITEYYFVHSTKELSMAAELNNMDSPPESDNISATEIHFQQTNYNAPNSGTQFLQFLKNLIHYIFIYGSRDSHTH